ncbi:MAG: hypothetical protein Edafosvirus11_17 [Edafosvirus sp.]|uniref:Uncharacterized protein n=1 Tax=Edafosvirus sp. TaxID=2487765 RepID=A0A3G4ZU06_9VIRU|nr:MAG: hypothetical protein Edafosvirus11_17 [Edafosvirus sp.]
MSETQTIKLAEEIKTNEPNNDSIEFDLNLVKSDIWSISDIAKVMAEKIALP